MIRVVLELSKSLYAMTLVDEKELGPTMRYQDRTYYRALVKDHFILYRGAISGWGHYGFDAAPGQR